MVDSQYAKINNHFQCENLKHFFETRLEYVKENIYPTILAHDPPSRLVVHLIPERYKEISININDLEKTENNFISYGDSSQSTISEFNFDGILFHTNAHEKRSYTQVFRNGVIETVVVVAEPDPHGKKNLISPIKVEENLSLMLASHLNLFHKYHIPGPYNLFFRMLETEDLRFNPEDLKKLNQDAKGRNKALILEELNFDPYQLEYAEINVRKALIPFLDTLWNTFGFNGAP